MFSDEQKHEESANDGYTSLVWMETVIFKMAPEVFSKMKGPEVVSWQCSRSLWHKNQPNRSFLMHSSMGKQNMTVTTRFMRKGTAIFHITCQVVDKMKIPKTVS